MENWESSLNIFFCKKKKALVYDRGFYFAGKAGRPYIDLGFVLHALATSRHILFERRQLFR